MNKIKASAIISFLTFYLSDYIIVLILGNSDIAYIIFNVYLILYQFIFPAFYIFLIFLLIFDFTKSKNFLFVLIFLSLCVSLEIFKAKITNQHFYSPLHKTYSLSKKEILLKKRNNYRERFLNSRDTENPIFLDNNLESEDLYTVSINNKNLKLRYSDATELRQIFNSQNAINLSFLIDQEYYTEFDKTNFDKIMEYRTDKGRISFFILDNKIQNCIFESQFEESKLKFLKKCHQNQKYYEAFWETILKSYCPQRSLNFQKSNECDTLIRDN